jgi:hypothetical protein
VFPHTNLPSPPFCQILCPSHCYWIDRPNNIWRSVQIILKPTPFVCYRVPIRVRCLPQDPFLKHPQPTSLPQYDRPSFTPIQNSRQNYISAYFILYIFIENWNRKTLHRMIVRKFDLLLIS